jgi:outer membrane protein OmpA-like peptidoglycan-associated protein
MVRTLSSIVGLLLLLTACGESPRTMSLQQPPAAPPLSPRTWMVFFDTNSVALSDQANMTVGAAADIAKSMGTARVTVSGYTDTEGAVAYNQALSVRRANAVKDALVRNGVAPASIAVVGEGEMGQLVPTGDQVKYPSNRRVAIVVQ